MEEPSGRDEHGAVSAPTRGTAARATSASVSIKLAAVLAWPKHAASDSAAQLDPVCQRLARLDSLRAEFLRHANQWPNLFHAMARPAECDALLQEYPWQELLERAATGTLTADTGETDGSGVQGAFFGSAAMAIDQFTAIVSQAADCIQLKAGPAKAPRRSDVVDRWMECLYRAAQPRVHSIRTADGNSWYVSRLRRDVFHASAEFLSNDLRARLCAFAANWRLIESDRRVEVLVAAENAYFEDLCPLAAEVIRRAGSHLPDTAAGPLEQFSDDASHSPCEVITGAPDENEAGRRMLLWSAACCVPGVDSSYRDRLRHWIDRSMIVPGPVPGQWRTLPHVFDWAVAAVRAFFPPTILATPVPAQAPGEADRELKRATDRFLQVMYAVTIPTEDGRYIPDYEGAKALSIATQALYEAIPPCLLPFPVVAGVKLVRMFSNRSVPPKAYVMQPDELDAQAQRMAAIMRLVETTTFSAARWNEMQEANPGQNHMRWMVGDVVSNKDIALVESVERLLESAAAGSPTEPLSEASSVPKTEESECVSQSGHMRPYGPCAAPPESATSRHPPCESRKFRGGKILFFTDHVELCGVDICSGTRSKRTRRALELLSQSRHDGRFASYSGIALAKKLECTELQAAGIVRGLRIRIRNRLFKVGIECGLHDVILSRGPGYRFGNCISVHDSDVARTAQITDTKRKRNVRNVRKANVRNPDVRNSSARARQTWILERLAEGDQLRAPAVVAHFKCALKTAERDLQSLKDDGQIEFVGATRGGYYRLRKAL